MRLTPVRRSSARPALTGAAQVLLGLWAATCLLTAPAQAQGQWGVTANADSQRLAPLDIEFRANVGTGISVVWDFGDGHTASGAAVQHTYYRPGHYLATMSFSQNGRLLGQGQLPIAVRSQGAERAGLVVLLGRGTVTLSDVGSVIYGPYQPRYSLDGQPLGTTTAALRAGTHTAAVQTGNQSRSVRFSVPSTPLMGSAAAEQQVLDAVNRLRTAGYNCATGRFDGRRLAPLRRNAALDRAALAHAIAMPTANFMDHVSQLDGSTPAQRIAAAGYPRANTAENLAAGQTSAAEAMEGWRTSPGHCASMLGDFSEIGLSYVQLPGSDLGHYWVQTFGKPVP
ncbi:CAP domain-containing protein [Deinococcus radiophilus]|nr:CAP domain-containing protein [Deinococcus radiophilus]UFA49781.1 CAP domain-containing protein [Deinococcus radiophilus]